MIHVIASIRTREGNREALMAEFRLIVPVVQAKAGCIEYSLANNVHSGFPGQLPFDANELIIVERWADLDSLKSHITDEEYQTWFANVWKLVAGASMQVFEAVD